MRHFILIIICFAFAQNAKAQDTTLAKFLMIGHAYGSQDTTVPQWKSIIDNAEKIKKLNTDYYVFLGDAIKDTTEKNINSLHTLLLERALKASCCSAIYISGNHDNTEKINGYCSCCFNQETFFDIIERPTNFTHNDTTLDNYEIRRFPYHVLIINTESNQNIDSLIKSAVNHSKAPNIIFLSHRLIWAYSNPRYKHLVELTNSPTMHQLPQVVDIDFLNQQKDKKFYFFAGDLGVNIPLFYDKVGNVTLYATGCGGTDKDNALLAEFKRDTIITSVVHLGKANYTIADYTLEKINAIPLPNVTISAPQGFKGYQWPVFLSIFAVMALALYMVIKPHE